uniref:Putative transcriptional coactivator caper rrm superfamily n=1 Tax=Ixodes ricinus TaxID=34613 RepID=V5I294_IXORI
MPYRDSDSDSGSTSRRKKKKRTHRSSSSSGDEQSSSRHRHRKKNARGSHQEKSRRRRSRSSSSSRYSSKTTSRKRRSRSTSRHRRSRSRTPSSRRRSRSRSPKHRSGRSRSGSSSRRHSRSASDSPRRSSRRSTSSSPRRARRDSPDLRNVNDADRLKLKIQQVMKAAGTNENAQRGRKSNASAELSKKGLLPKGSSNQTSTPPTMQEQLERARMIEDINAPSFSQQVFVSRAGKKDGGSLKEVDNHTAAIFGSLETLVAANKEVVPLCNWREKPELLVHDNLMESSEAKLERWRKKLAAERRKRINGVSLGGLARTDT